MNLTCKIFMLTRDGPYNEEALVEAARKYIKHYAWKKEIEEVKIPFMEQSTREVKYVRFILVLDQWVFVEICGK